VRTGVAVWAVFAAHPWLLVVCLVLVLATVVGLVCYLVERTGPDDDVSVWVLAVRVAVRRRRTPTAEPETPEPE
jgi:hypothetical protein